MGADSRTTTGGGGTLAQSARDRRSGDRGAAAVRRRPAAAHADGGAVVRSRLSRGERADDAGRSARRRAIRRRRSCSSSSTRSKPKSARCPAWQTWRGRARCRSASRSTANIALTYEIVGDRAGGPRRASRPPNYQIVSPTYFSTLDLPIVAGRAFDARDTRDSPRVCIVNEAFARTLGGRNPIGMQVVVQALPTRRRTSRTSARSSAWPSR